jgi:hypothetical protein
MTATQGGIGSCRSDGCDNPRRVRRGLVEPLCEDCYRQARRRVADQLADEETAAERRNGYRRFQINPGQQGSPQQASANGTSKPPAADSRKHGRQAGGSRFSQLEAVARLLECSRARRDRRPRWAALRSADARDEMSCAEGLWSTRAPSAGSEAFPDHPAEAHGDASAGWSESDRVSAWQPSRPSRRCP